MKHIFLILIFSKRVTAVADCSSKQKHYRYYANYPKTWSDSDAACKALARPALELGGLAAIRNPAEHDKIIRLGLLNAMDGDVWIGAIKTEGMSAWQWVSSVKEVQDFYSGDVLQGIQTYNGWADGQPWTNYAHVVLSATLEWTVVSDEARPFLCQFCPFENREALKQPENCPSAVKQYRFVGEILGWADAQSKCRELTEGTERWSNLASIRTPAEHTKAQALSVLTAWVGGTDIETEGEWRWIDDNALFYRHSDSKGQIPSGYFDGQHSIWMNPEPDDIVTIAGTNKAWGDFAVFRFNLLAESFAVEKLPFICSLCPVLPSDTVIDGVPAYCDSSNRVLIQRYTDNNCVAEYTWALFLQRDGCGYLKESAVRRIAAHATKVVLEASVNGIGAQSLESDGADAIEALQTGNHWQQTSISWKHSFIHGQHVEARKGQRTDVWYQGVVWKVNDNGTYAIAFDDGDFTEEIRERIRPLPMQYPTFILDIGQRVEARRPSSDPDQTAWYDGTVGLHTGKEVTIMFDDRSTEAHIYRADMIRPRQWLGSVSTGTTNWMSWVHNTTSCGKERRWPDMYDACGIPWSMSWLANPGGTFEDFNDGITGSYHYEPGWIHGPRASHQSNMQGVTSSSTWLVVPAAICELKTHPANSCSAALKLYRYFAGPLSWHDARAACEVSTFLGMYGSFATIRSQDEQLMVARLGFMTDTLIGGTDAQQKGTWRWVGDDAVFWQATAECGQTIAFGKEWSEPVLQSTLHLAACRCVTNDGERALSMCASLGEAVCQESDGCSNNKPCACMPVGISSDLMTFLQCEEQCTRITMHLPKDHEDVERSRGTGCLFDTEPIWVGTVSYCPSSASPSPSLYNNFHQWTYQNPAPQPFGSDFLYVLRQSSADAGFSHSELYNWGSHDADAAYICEYCRMEGGQIIETVNVENVRGYCDKRGRILIQRANLHNIITLGSSCESVAELKLDGCGFLSDASVQILAAHATAVTLEDRGRGSVTSFTIAAVKQLQFGGNWHEISVTDAWHNPNRWSWKTQCLPIDASWPDMYQSCGCTNCVHWLSSRQQNTMKIPASVSAVIDVTQNTGSNFQTTETWLTMKPGICWCSQLNRQHKLDSDAHCTVCELGQFWDALQGQCEDCPANQKGDGTQTSCEECRASDREHSLQGAHHCEVCHLGQFWDALQGQCEDCPANQKGDGTQTSCQPCLPGSADYLSGFNCARLLFDVDVPTSAVETESGSKVSFPLRPFCLRANSTDFFSLPNVSVVPYISAGSVYDPFHFADCCAGELMESGIGAAESCRQHLLSCASAVDSTFDWTIIASSDCSAMTGGCIKNYFRCVETAAFAERSGAQTCSWANELSEMLQMLQGTDSYSQSKLRADCTEAVKSLIVQLGCDDSDIDSVCLFDSTPVPVVGDVQPERQPSISAPRPEGMNAMVVRGDHCQICERAFFDGSCFCPEDTKIVRLRGFHGNMVYGALGSSCYGNGFNFEMCLTRKTASNASDPRSINFFSESPSPSPEHSGRREGDSAARSCKQVHSETEECQCPAEMIPRPLLLPVPIDARTGVPKFDIHRTVFCAPETTTVHIINAVTGSCFNPLGENITCDCVPDSPSVVVPIAFVNQTTTLVSSGLLRFCSALPQDAKQFVEAFTGALAMVSVLSSGSAAQLQGMESLTLVDCEKTGRRKVSWSLVPLRVGSSLLSGLIGMIILIVAVSLFHCLLVLLLAALMLREIELEMANRLRKAASILMFPGVAVSVAQLAVAGSSVESMWLLNGRGDRNVAEYVAGVSGLLVIAGLCAEVCAYGIKCSRIVEPHVLFYGQEFSCSCARWVMPTTYYDCCKWLWCQWQMVFDSCVIRRMFVGSLDLTFCSLAFAVAASMVTSTSLCRGTALMVAGVIVASSLIVCCLQPGRRPLDKYFMLCMKMLNFCGALRKGLPNIFSSVPPEVMKYGVLAVTSLSICYIVTVLIIEFCIKQKIVRKRKSFISTQRRVTKFKSLCESDNSFELNDSCLQSICLVSFLQIGADYSRAGVSLYDLCGEPGQASTYVTSPHDQQPKRTRRKRSVVMMDISDILPNRIASVRDRHPQTPDISLSLSHFAEMEARRNSPIRPLSSS